MLDLTGETPTVPDMSWVTVIWSMTASACLTLGLMYGLIWLWRRTAWANLLFALTAVATTVFAASELWLMRAETPEEVARAVRWMHVPAWVLVVSLVGFVRLYLKAGRRWLAWGVCGMRTLSLLLNFVTGINLNFQEITAVRRIPFLGELVSVPAGVPNPWMLVAQLSLILLVIFVADAAVTVWRRGARRQALSVGGSMVLFILLATVQVTLVSWGIVLMPITASLFYLGIVAAMVFELSHDLLRADQLSDELRESEERMSLAAEAANVGAWVWNPAKDELWMTERGRALFGFAPDTRLDYAALQGRVHPEDRPARAAAVQRAIQTMGEYHMEYRVLLPDGTVRWIGALGHFTTSSKDGVPRLVGISMDITARKLAQDALQESEARFHTMADAAPVMIWMSDTDKLCTYFNKGWLEFTGRTLEQELGNGWAEGVHEQDFDDCLEIYRNAFDARQPFTMDYRLRRSDGEYRWVLDNGTPRFASDGTFMGYIGSCIDITARRRSEQETLLLREEIAHVGRVSVMGQLASALAHEINQPLGAILRNAEAAEILMQVESPDLEEIRAILGDIRRDDQRAGAVIDRMRSLLKRRSLKTRTLDVGELVDDVVAIAQAHAAARMSRLDVDVTDDLPPVRGDRVHVQQVLLNLILNAMDALSETAARDHCVTVRVRLCDGAQMIEIGVSDNGDGVPADHLTRVFDPFFTTKPNGLGMGLPISRTIIEAHGGRLWAENNQGGGATFRFTLPTAEEAAAS